MLHVNGDCPVRNIPLKHQSNEQWASPLALLTSLFQHCWLQWASPLALLTSLLQHCWLQWASPPALLTSVSISPALLAAVSISTSIACFIEHLLQQCLLWYTLWKTAWPSDLPLMEKLWGDLVALRRQQLLQEELMFQSNHDDCGKRSSVTEKPHWNKYPRWMCRSMK